MYCEMHSSNTIAKCIERCILPMHDILTSTFAATDGHFIIYSRPPGALRGMRAFNHTILFYLTNNTCTYTASIPTLTAEMPFGFANLLGFNMTDVCVGWQVCSGMKYLETLIYFNKKTDVWFKQIPNASGQPDNITVLVDSKTHIPITATRVHPGHPGTFDPPRTIKTFDLVTSESPNAQFTLPSQWQLKCQNLDAKVLTDSQSLFYVTPKGGDFLHVWLSDMPVEGNVTVTFHVNPIPPCPCTDCIMFNPPTLTFTSSNYTQEQVVEFVYEKDGVTNFMFTVDGGGYYNRGSNKEYGTIYTCHNGIPRKSCPSSWQ